MLIDIKYNIGDSIYAIFNPNLIHLTNADISKWYVIRRDLTPKEIIEIKDMF